MSGLVLGNDPIQFLAPAPRTNMGKGNAIVSSQNPGVRGCVGNDRRSDQRRGPGQKCPAVHFAFWVAHLLLRVSTVGDFIPTSSRTPYPCLPPAVSACSVRR